MGQKDCGLSLIKKPCVRERFPCSRCGAKIVNAGLMWEVSVPKYQRWFYMDPGSLAVNGAAAVSPIVVTAPNIQLFNDEEVQGQSPCRFEGPSYDEGYQITDDATPASGPQFVQDLEWSRYDDDFDGWNQFARSHQIKVFWQAAEVDSQSGELITPGGWRITLIILQQAIGFTESVVQGQTLYIHQNVAPGGSFINTGNGSGDPGDTDINDASVITRVYYPPAGYSCLSDETTRWTRPIPPLPILSNTFYTKASLPSGYDWPDGLAATTPSQGPFYPSGFGATNDLYYAPPYIDVRHVPK